jgi:hypothetical protein
MPKQKDGTENISPAVKSAMGAGEDSEGYATGGLKRSCQKSRKMKINNVGTVGRLEG